MKLLAIVLSTLALLAAPALAQQPAASPAAAASPQRKLVYSFTYGMQGNLSEHNSLAYGEGGHGSTDYKGSENDNGTITVDVVREQPDRGLIVSISEQGANRRRSDPATCVVYGNTNVICDPNAQINSEEMTLLRFLGTTFVDPNQIDAKQHWGIDESNNAGSIKADYTIQSNDNGVMTIAETRVVKESGGQPLTTNVSAKIVYDFPKLVPTSVDEYAEIRQEQGPSGTQTTTIQTSLKLVSDTMKAG